MPTPYFLLTDETGTLFFTRLALGRFWMCDDDPRVARQFSTYRAALQVLKTEWKHRQGWRIIRAEEVSCPVS